MKTSATTGKISAGTGTRSRSSKRDNDKNASTKVSKQMYYHCYLPREEVENILLNVGDYLARETIMPDKRAGIVLSVRASTTVVEHFQTEFNVDDLEWHLEQGIGKPNIPELIEHYRKKAIPIKDCILKTPIARNKWEILDHQIKFEGKKLGQGHFATVHKGQFQWNDKWIVVAIKRLRAERIKAKADSIKAKEQILREFQIGRRLFPHQRVMAVYGLYVGSEELAVICEFCDGGSLNDYLKKQSENQIPIPIYAKLNYLVNAADGLNHMHRLNLIHRDVAARNFLMVKREQFGQLPLVKVSDFGLTRPGPIYEMKTEHEIPYVITAIECLADKNPQWTVKSDCWSYGVLMFEIFNECRIEPYHDVMPQLLTTVRDFIEKGGRLPPHETMPNECKVVMTKCFDSDPKKRPPMKEIRDTLSPLIRKHFNEQK